MDEFIGRTDEIKELHGLLNKRSANLVIIKGRRRIGKSRLAQEFANKHIYYEFVGLPPTKETTAQSERNEFALQLGQALGIPGIKADDWSTLFVLLSKHLDNNKKTIILFDEISWMGSKDPNFLGKLKTSWDIYFKTSSNLMLILCGSVTSWIERNIVNSTGFLGRPSLYMTLDELPLTDCNKFWGVQGKGVSAFEKFKFLSVTGGIPRYLELLDPNISAEENIRRLCFSKNGPLVDEFEHIFADIFSKRSELYRKIVEQLVLGVKDADTLCNKVGLTRTGKFSEYLEDLVCSGFIAQDYTYNISSGEISSLSRYRLKDNYVRFYLKYMSSNKERIKNGDFKDISLSSLPGWETIMGLQFENLIVNNHHEVIKLLGLRQDEIVFNNPFFQRTTLRQAGCQIDYLIQTKLQSVYVCEVKFSKNIVGVSILKEMQDKINKLKLPKRYSYRLVLIHVNGVHQAVVDSGFFSAIIDFNQLLM